MTVLVTVDFHLKPEGAQILIDTMKERLPFTRSYEGCEQIHVFRDQDDPNHLVLVEYWESREHYARYREWAMAQPGTEQLIPFMEGDMTTHYLEKVDA